MFACLRASLTLFDGSIGRLHAELTVTASASAAKTVVILCTLICFLLHDTFSPKKVAKIGASANYLFRLDDESARGVADISERVTGDEREVDTGDRFEHPHVVGIDDQCLNDAIPEVAVRG